MNEFQDFEDARASSEARAHGGRPPDRRSSSIWAALSRYLRAEQRHTLEERRATPDPARGRHGESHGDTDQPAG